MKLLCEKCKEPPVALKQETVMVNYTDPATEGQSIDFDVAEASGDFEEYDLETRTTCYCKKCGNILEIQG